MKKMKRLAALFLAVVMVMAMGMTVAAAEITINNPQQVVEGEEKTDATYEAFKIFSLTTSTTTNSEGKTITNYSYKLDSSSAAYTKLSDLIEEDKPSYTGHGFTITKTTAAGVYNASVSDAPTFAAYLKTLDLTGGIPGVKDGDKVKIDIGNNIGYYFVSTNSGALADLTTANDQLEIYDKNEKPQITKTADDASVEVGQVVKYTIEGTVPSTVGYTSYQYVIKDAMTEGLTFNDDVSNTLDDSVEAAKVGNGFTLTFDMAAKNANGTNKYTVGTKFTVTYTATVNDKAIVRNSETNSATLTYSNDPTDSNKTTPTPPVEVKVYTASIIIDKYDSADATKATKLANAEFVLKNANDSTAKYYKYTAATEATPAKVEWVDTIADATKVTTDANGAAQFNGLEDGKYYLEETKAPAGYNLMTEAEEIEVKGDATNKTKVDATADVPNAAGAILPSTGGIGTTIFYVVGGILVLGAAVLLITKKRMSARD
mgnify:CR=1 FL=1